jgi:glycosyltransferase involved in cell wall biosynthesis
MKVCFLDQTDFKYSQADRYSPKLRGAETILINLTIELKKLGHDVTVINNCPEINESNWINIKKKKKDNIIYDLAISNADARLFDKITAKKKVVLSYSLQSIEKFIRKKQLIAYLKHKPTYFLIGEYHKKNRSKLISLFGTNILNLSVDDIFLETELNKKIIKNQAIFTSRADRNLELLLQIWKNKIYPRNNDINLLVTPYKSIDNNFNIFHRKMNTQQNLINDLISCKVFLVPGHKAELFCLAAEEARELCLPVVTLGIGSLSERVIHGKTGFIAKNQNEFAEHAIELFKNDKLWNQIRNNLINLRGKNNWKSSTVNFLEKVELIKN